MNSAEGAATTQGADRASPAGTAPDATPSTTMEVLTGTVICEGVAIGTALVLAADLRVPLTEISPQGTSGELTRFDAALAASRAQITDLQARSANSEQTVRVLESHLFILEDPLFVGEIIQRIQTERNNAEWIVAAVVQEWAMSFESLEDAYLRDRSCDVKDVGYRILRNLMGSSYPCLDNAGPQTILVCHQLSPSEVASVHIHRVRGIIAETGGRTSHAAILARGLGIPALIGVEGATHRIASGTTIVLDAIEGRVRINPVDDEVLEYSRLQQRLVLSRQQLVETGPLEARTSDGVLVTLRANVSLAAEVESLAKFGARGVGLFRTEYLFLGRDSAPDEEEQYQVYRKVVEASNDVTVFRTMDIGGDKKVPYLNIPPEPNPFLGWRSIRYCLDHPELLATQLRALLRAGVHGPMRLMYPMITCVEEVRAANAVLAAVKIDLAARNIPFADDVPVGVMIEVPAAALHADALAREVAFFSIGTNDLIQYTLAVDRTNSRLAAAFDLMPVPVLRLIQQVERAARAAGIPVSVCGEIGSTPEGFVLLLGLGLTEFSMNVFALPTIKHFVRSISSDDAERVARRALQAATTQELRDALTEVLKDRLPQKTKFGA